MNDDKYIKDDFASYLRLDDNFLKIFQCNVKIDKNYIDRFNNIGLSRLQRIYKRLFPTRFEINRKVKRFMVRKKMEDLTNRIDTFLAWGDPIE